MYCILHNKLSHECKPTQLNIANKSRQTQNYISKVQEISLLLYAILGLCFCIGIGHHQNYYI